MTHIIPTTVIRTKVWKLTPKVTIYIPVITNLNNKTVQHSMNQRIQNMIHHLLVIQGYFQNKDKAEVISTFEVKNNERGILSLTISNYTYMEGAAHGLTIIQSLTFHTETGKLYSLQDLFTQGSEYVELISEEIEKQIKIRDIPTLQPFTKIKENQYFYIADKTVVIFFQAYEISPVRRWATDVSNQLILFAKYRKGRWTYCYVSNE